MNKSRKSIILKTVIITLMILVTISYILSEQSKVKYAPFVTDSKDLALNIVEAAKIMEGTSEGDLMVAISDGSKIFAKGGLNYIVLKNGEDEIYYSLCSTKIIEGKVNVVEGFDPKHDKLKIFCAHNKIISNDIKIIHDTFNEKEITYIQVQGKHSMTAIALLGKVDIKVEDIILNERWKSDIKKDVVKEELK